MKHIIVIAGNITQFKDFVSNAVKEGTFASTDYSVDFGSKVVTEGIMFMYVYSAEQLRGYTLSREAELVKVGTWYELGSKIITDIERQFKQRKIVSKTQCQCKSCQS